MTFTATAAAALYCGLEPVFVDINEYDLNINFEDKGIDIFKTNSLSVKNYSFILKDNINFGKDSVSVELKHAIRPANSSTAIQNLKGILSVGLLAE